MASENQGPACCYGDRFALGASRGGKSGDVKPVGGPISEMRIFVGKGYRIYFVIQRERLITLLCGGIKSSKKQQQQDIRKAKRILDEFEN